MGSPAITPISGVFLDFRSKMDYPIRKSATARQPIINHLIREYAVEVNILFASMSEVQGRILGFMIVQLLGEPDETERAITHLVDAGVKITHV